MYTLWSIHDNDETLVDSFNSLQEIYKYIHNYKKINNFDVPYIREWQTKTGTRIDFGSYSEYFEIRYN